MIGMRQSRKRVELILMVFIGLAWGILLSELMRRNRWHGTSRNDRVMDGDPTSSLFPSSRRSNPYPPSPTTTPIIYTEDSKALAANLFNKTRILCMVLTSPKTHQSRAVHIQRTWGTRCHKLIFMSTKADKELGAVALNVREGHSNLWGKTRASLQYVYKHHFRNYDWFLKADDETYVVMENLRSFLHAYSPKSSIYFGSQFRKHEKKGGTDYVLSKTALHQFMKFAFDNSSICSNLNIGYEEVELKRCLQSVDVVAGNSRDENGLSRFIPYSPFQWSPDTATNDISNCCSDSVISFHDTYAKEFYVLDYIIYKLKYLGFKKDQTKKSYLDVSGNKHSSQPEKIVPSKRTTHRITAGNNVTKAKYKPKIKVKSQSENLF